MLDIMYIISERDKRERERRERERDEGRQLPLYIDDKLPVEKPEVAEDCWRS